MSVPSVDEIRGAIDALVRNRPVESPPDAQGVRKVWHRGSRAAVLVTELDGVGRIVRQELNLFDERVQWQPSAGLVDADGPAAVQARTRMLRYAGADRLLQHLRDQFAQAHAGVVPAAEPAVSPQPVQQPRQKRPNRVALVLTVLSGLLFLVLLARACGQ